MNAIEVTLDDKYRQLHGPVFMTGMQALVRLALEQRRSDARAGLNTAGFVSGYRGSPMGGFDRELWRAQSFLDEHHIRFQPGVNEEIAATSLWGTQQVSQFPGPRYDGVFGIWYGKGPGLDRSGDAIRHANQAGSSQHGGVLAIVGDDHASKSSAFGAQSEFAFVDWMMPVVVPAGVKEFVSFGLFGFALSRFCGLWTGFKLAGISAESSAIVDIPDQRAPFVIPTDIELPPGGLNIRASENDRGAYEERVKRYRLPAAIAFARANGIDRTEIDSGTARVGILTAGKAYLDVRQAFADLGLDDDQAAAAGIRLRKLGMVWPLDPVGIRTFAEGLDLIIVVEEKRGLIEEQVKAILFDAALARSPRVVGKRDEQGSILLTDSREIDPILVAEAIVPRLVARGAPTSLNERLASVVTRRGKIANADVLTRTPYFCSGCPHNRSTVAPENSVVIAGIGCHTMARAMDRSILTMTHMGGEGASWIGISPFTDLKHIFQNVGDGTYFHSGQLCVRATVAADVPITFKILYNDAVAMTGGQPLDGTLTVPQLTQQLKAEGVKRIALVADDPGKYPPDAGIPQMVTVHHRDDLDAVQRELANFRGVSALIYDQTCAAEKRRRRKRGQFPDPARRAVINEAVCEGCGDCGVKSNCLSVRPVETELGTKRQIDQSSCNKDFSCLDGFCPSFVTIEGGQLRKAAPVVDRDAEIPEPVLADCAQPLSILVAGIGGTGIVTIGALLGTAARTDNKVCTVNDVTGSAQKGGLVASHVIVAERSEAIHAERIAAGAAKVLIAADIVVAAMPDILSRVGAGTEHAIINTGATQTGSFLRNAKARFPVDELKQRLVERLDEARTEFVPADTYARSLTGDILGVNLLLLGMAWQKGWIPLTRMAIEKAIRLNGVAVEANLAAFGWGRRIAVQPGLVADSGEGAAPDTSTLDGLIAHRAKALIEFQGSAYSERYCRAVEWIRRLEQERVPGQTALSEAVARYGYKLMAYKDEYEVARLLSDPAFFKRIEREFEGPYKVVFHMAPPLLAKKDSASGRLRKRAYGPSTLLLLRGLAKLRGLRGTWADPFGYTLERRTERRLIEEYLAFLDEIGRRLTPENHAVAVALASLPDEIRGYGHVKDASIARAAARRAQLLEQLQSSGLGNGAKLPVREVGAT
ncbi:indolepyruvate ferredoxin oxidoreductase family protein [Bradyrhizobium sp. LHD-71]|uniref:indolepyruvate ferredoxin oxidoreductase family protein n=1 Tax=Bradyrhizobium sp. LHD-71 TaxID=3072141 RepID=UPI00280C8956|nr:indolepyruvate ferredoxin oxidoreductase family protein [Bradyrhizobium sp. LHD-71]MDQ8727368.1 indolepyruvate ferredoxin oxidoreductase family protein [Bradyrhizobium sp. LHD-71]